MHHTDYLVIGSSLAGMAAALFLAEHGQVTLLALEPVDFFKKDGRRQELS
jgi:glycine/D-amino acid oxidase-like deaminating enzyme